MKNLFRKLGLLSLLLLAGLMPLHAQVATDVQQLQALQQIPPTSPAPADPPARNPQPNNPGTITTVTTSTQNAPNPAPPPPDNGGAIQLPPTQTPPAIPGDFPGNFNQQAAIVVQGAPQPPLFQAPFTPPTTIAPDPNSANQAAFNSMVNTVLPMTPDQIHRLKQIFTATQYAQAAPPGVPPKPVATSQMVNLSPGATPPVIRLAQGFVTSLVFIDSTGAPWPIESYSIGDPQRFNIQWNKVDNTLMVQAMSLYNYGNLAVRLKTLNTPVMLTLIPGQKDIDYRVDLRIQAIGPNAKPPLMGGMNGDAILPPSANPILLSVLDAVPPPGSRELNVCGPDIQAWLLGRKLYVRTHFTILSPAWLGTMSSADGTKAYEMLRTPMLLVSVHGKAMPIRIEGY